MKQIPVAVLGATGTVGQKFIRLLQNHPWFRIAELVASTRSSQRRYGDVVRWREASSLADSIANLTVVDTTAQLDSKILFSALDSSVAGDAELAYAQRGHIVVSNSKNHRTDADVPLVITEVNADHFALCKAQPYSGAIITNPNCVAIPLTLALAPLHSATAIDQVLVTSLQAISGAGYPGVASLDILGNVIPNIAGEEEKIEQEPQKILGTLNNDCSLVQHAGFTISAQATRVPIYDGHTLTASVKLAEQLAPSDAVTLLTEYRGVTDGMELPSLPPSPIIVQDDDHRPTVLRDLYASDGMAITVGRIRTCPINTLRMVILGHNTVRGAAGAAILNAEAYTSMGYL